jgi:chromosome segregation ATPase
MGSDEPLINAEAELIALQKNFDDYIAESRELEEELEQEVLKLQKKLEVSNASNSALVARLESVTPQLLGLEKEIQQLRLKLEDEVILRRQAEQEQDKAESARRAAESTVQRLQEENDALHEELAFHSSELEEVKSALHEVTLRQEEECNML